ncbi:MAG: DUF362 domain-containing protein [Candidatus Poribacteria bacterium]|nr:DUF362 domain-containing protein [Candidatus Poribacteria bacterium]
MAYTLSPIEQSESDPIVAQIRADCAQVSSAETTAPRPLSRRRFLSQVSKGVIGAGLALGSLGAGTDTAFAQLDTPFGTLEGELQNRLVPVVEAMSEKVWEGDALNEQIVGEMIDRAMMKLTGLDSAKEAWKDFVLPNDIVGIKINPLAGKQLSTHRVIVDKIIDGLYGVGVLKNQIIIWDRFEAHLISAGYKINQSDQGVRCFASDSQGVGYDDEVHYETEKDVEIRREYDSIRCRYTKILTQEATVIINVPVLKHHAITGVSGCLKNLAFGSVDNTRRFHSTPLNCNPAIGDIFAHSVIKDKLVLNIVDGLLAAFEGGPTYDPEGTWHYGGILVSPDAVALDQIALQTIDEKRKELKLASISRLAKYIRSAWRLGLGTNDLDEVDYQEVKV